MLDGGSGILSGCKLHSHCLLLKSPSADGGWFESLEWMSLLVTGISFQDRPLACLLISKIRPGGPGCEKILGIPNSFGSLFIEGPSICGAPNPGSGCHGWSCRKAMPCGYHSTAVLFILWGSTHLGGCGSLTKMVHFFTPFILKPEFDQQ